MASCWGTQSASGEVVQLKVGVLQSLLAADPLLGIIFQALLQQIPEFGLVPHEFIDWFEAHDLPGVLQLLHGPLGVEDPAGEAFLEFVGAVGAHPEGEGP